MAEVRNVVNDPSEAHLYDDPEEYLAECAEEWRLETALIGAAEARGLTIERKAFGETRWMAVHGTPAQLVEMLRALGLEKSIRVSGRREYEELKALGWQWASIPCTPDGEMLP